MIQFVSELEVPKVQKILIENFGFVLKDDPFAFYVKYEDSVLKGILSYSLIYDRIEINYLWVNTFYRKKGIGTALLSYLDEVVKNESIKNISLEVECENSSAIHLYKKCGYKIVATRKKYYHGKDGYLMVKEVVK